MCFNAYILALSSAFLIFVSIPVFAVEGDTIGVCESHHYNVTGGDTPEGKPVNGRLNSIILHKVDFEKQDIVEVIKFLSNKSKELDPTHVGVEIRLELSRTTPSTSFPVRPVHRTVNLTLDDRCLAEVLAYICEESNMGYRIIDKEIVMRPM